MAVRKLTEKQAGTIRGLFEALEAKGDKLKRGEKAKLKLKLAEKHGVTVATIDRARTGRTYKQDQPSA